MPQAGLTEQRRTVRNLAVFTVVVLSIGFVGRALDVQMGAEGEESLGMLIWLVVPTAMALLLRGFGGDGWRDFGIAPRFRGNGAWYGVSLAIYPVLTAVAVVLGAALGRISLPGLTLGSFAVIGQTFLIGALPQFIKNIFEEAAWRGYLAPRVHALGLNDFVGHTVVGLIWGLWHIPYYLYYLDREILAQFSTLSVGWFIVQATVVMIAWAIVYGELYLLTRSIWPAVLMHMVEDAFLNQLIMDEHIRITPGSDWLVSPVNGVIGLGLFVIVGVALNRIRRAREAAAPV